MAVMYSVAPVLTNLHLSRKLVEKRRWATKKIKDICLLQNPETRRSPYCSKQKKKKKKAKQKQCYQPAGNSSLPYTRTATQAEMPLGEILGRS